MKLNIKEVIPNINIIIPTPLPIVLADNLCTYNDATIPVMIDPIAKKREISKSKKI